MAAESSKAAISSRPSREVVLLGMVATVLGAALRIWQYAANSSLWLDEIALVSGILDRDLVNLLSGPLPSNQVAPKGFLLIQKLVSLSLGASDYILRIFPFVCALIALVFFGHLAMRMLRGAAVVVAIALFATSAPLIIYAAIVKQYSTDVCIAVLLCWLAYELVSAPVTAKRAGKTALVGVVLVWFSQPAVFMIAALGASSVLLLQAAPSDVNRWRRLTPVLGGWGISALAVTVAGFASIEPNTRDYVDRVWAAGYAPLSLTRFLDTFWPWDQMVLLFRGGPSAHAGFGYPLPSLYTALIVIGLMVLWFQNRRAALLLTAPILVTLGAAVARQYPFSDRFILFLVPGFILAIAAAIGAAYQVCVRFSRLLGVFVAVALALPAISPVFVTPPTYRFEHVKAVLSYLQARWQPRDMLYVYYGAAPATTFYAAQYGLNRSDYVVGGCHRGDSRRYLYELDSFRGKPRIWVHITHSSPFYQEREDILAYLDAIGTRKDALSVESFAVGRKPLPAEVFLYDLSDPAKLANVTADSFKLNGPASVHPSLTCNEGPHVMIPSDFHEGMRTQ